MWKKTWTSYYLQWPYSSSRYSTSRCVCVVPRCVFLDDVFHLQVCCVVFFRCVLRASTTRSSGWLRCAVFTSSYMPMNWRSWSTTIRTAATSKNLSPFSKQPSVSVETTFCWDRTHSGWNAELTINRSGVRLSPSVLSSVALSKLLMHICTSPSSDFCTGMSSEWLSDVNQATP